MGAYLLLPTGLTFSDIREGLPAQSLPVLNGFLTSIGKPTVAIGDDNPLILKLNDFDMGGAPFTKGDLMSDLASCGPIHNIGHIPTFYIQLMVDVGGELTGFPVWFEVDPDDEIPAGFPNRTHIVYDDPEDPESDTTEVVHTWTTWSSLSPRKDLAPEELDGSWYVSNQNPWDAGTLLDASVWHDSTTFITKNEYLALQPTPEV